jgi:SEC-C motif domain protein
MMSILGKDCPCCSGKQYALCCEPYVMEMIDASTPELLMRARYSAFARRRFSFLTHSMTPEAAKSFSLAAVRRDAPYIRWKKLEIVRSEVTGASGRVEFKAYYALRGRVLILHEISRFEKRAGVWLYAGHDFLETQLPARQAHAEDAPAGQEISGASEAQVG